MTPWLGRSFAVLVILAALLFTTMEWAPSLTILAVVVAMAGASLLFLEPRPSALHVGYFGGLLVATLTSTLTYDLVDPWQLLVELVTISAAVVPATWCFMQVRSNLGWLAPGAGFSLAAAGPLFAWVTHDSYGDDQVVACGRFAPGGIEFGDAYREWLIGWSFHAPALAILVAGMALAWRQRNFDLAMATVLAGLATLALTTFGIAKQCD